MGLFWIFQNAKVNQIPNKEDRPVSLISINPEHYPDPVLISPTRTEEAT